MNEMMTLVRLFALERICRHWVIAVVTAGLMLGLTASAFGQNSTGSITGRVVDAKKALIADAKVTIANVDTNETSVVKTDRSGVYAASALPPGKYTVLIQKEGFEDSSVTGVEVNIAGTTSVDVDMKVGSTTATVIVSASQQMVDRSSPTISVDVPTEISEGIPLPERSAMEVVMLSPGVQGDPQYNMGVASENPGIYTAPITPGGSLSVGGGRPGSALQLVDGVDLSMVGYPRVGITFSGDDLQQITVQSGGVVAKYGRAGGGVINQASRGGTLIYHGKLAYRHEDPFFEATTYGQGNLSFVNASGQTVVVPVTQNVHQNLYTATLGGPVPLPFWHMNKKMFFFASYEPLRGGSRLYTRIRVPTPQELSGDFSNSYTLLNTTVLSTSGYAAAVAAPRVGGLDYEFPLNANGFPTGARYSSSSLYQPIPNYNLSAQLAQNPFASYVLSLFPKPGGNNKYINFLYPDGSYANDGNNALGARGVQNSDNRYNIRLDENLGGTDHLFERFTSVPVTGVRYSFLGPDSPINNQPTSVINSKNVLVDYTHIFGGTVVNDFHSSYTRLNYVVEPAPSTTTKDFAAQYGLIPAETGVGFPSLGLDTGTYGSSTGGNDGGLSINEVYSVGDDVSFVHGRHNFSFGGEWRAMQLDRLPNAGIFGGTYSFSTGTTNNGSSGGNATASFILGEINSATFSTVQEFYYRYKYVALYGMDAWRATPRLTINYGLRYNLEFPRTEKYGLQGSFVPGVTGTLNGVAATGAFAFSGHNGLPNTLYPVNYKGFEPRLGIAFAVKPELVVRGSFGLIHAPMTGVSNSAIPSLTPAALSIGGANGGTNPAAWVNYITNPVLLPSTGVPGVLRGPNPVFSYANTATAPPNLPWVSQSNSVPYTEVWSLSVQYQPAKNTMVQASYAGNASHHLFTAPADTNTMPLSTIISEVQSGFQFSSTSTASIYGSAVPSGNANINLLPYPQFSNNSIQSAYVRESAAIYHALYLNGIQRAMGGLTFIGSFTWSKSLDDGSSGSIDNTVTDSFGFSYPQTPFTHQGEWSYSTYDIPTHLTAAANWVVPFGKGSKTVLRNRFADALVSGFHISGIFNAESGYPSWPTVGGVGWFISTAAPTAKTPNPTPGGNGSGIVNGPGRYSLRPNINPGVPLIRPNWRNDPLQLKSSSGGFLNPAAFSIPGQPGVPSAGIQATPALGNSPRTLGNARSPRTVFFDMSASKDIFIGGRMKLQIKADAINALNHANFFLNPNSAHNFATTLNTTTNAYTINPTFGILTESTAGRTFALGAALTF